MGNWNAKSTIGSFSLNLDLFVAGTLLERAEVILDEATATYAPAVGDVLCYDSADTNKHQKYDRTIATHVIMGVIDELKEDNAGTPVVKMSYAVVASVHYAAINVTGTMNAAQKLALKNELRAKNIELVD